MSNDEKIFNLIEKMYIEVIELKEGQKFLEAGQKSLEEGQIGLRQTMVRMENDNHEKFGVLFDGLQQLNVKLDRHELENTACFNRIEKKLDIVMDKVAGHEEKFRLIK